MNAMAELDAELRKEAESLKKEVEEARAAERMQVRIKEEAEAQY